jgi:hypothetical protein
MKDNDRLAADYTALEAATGAVVLARRRLRAVRRARVLGGAEKADVVRARQSLGAARAELDACRSGVGWRVRRPQRRLRRPPATTAAARTLRRRDVAMSSRVLMVACMVTFAAALLFAQWPMRGPRLLGPGGLAAHAGDVLVIAATAVVAVVVLRWRS